MEEKFKQQKGMAEKMTGMQCSTLVQEYQKDIEEEKRRKEDGKNWEESGQ